MRGSEAWRVRPDRTATMSGAGRLAGWWVVALCRIAHGGEASLNERVLQGGRGVAQAALQIKQAGQGGQAAVERAVIVQASGTAHPLAR